MARQNCEDFKIHLDKFEFISQFNHILLTDFKEYYQFHPNFYLPPFNESFFDTSSNPISFKHLIKYLKEL